jgi:predicted acylesterase/phospholipase RssA
VLPPTVSVLFSGGVFRGVFLVGVLSALQELAVKPRLVAGSSVGSITAAMAARVFAASRDDARRLVAELAATYLSIDQLIITDRFADFVRRFTLRAAEAKLSPKDLDNVFRNYDRGTNTSFERRTRRVVAGLEHLLYVSPFELLALLRALRLQDMRRAYRLVRRYFQEVLDRGGVSMEVLGTEPLSLLIREHVVPEVPRDLRTIPFSTLTGPTTDFLVTATNLTKGRLEIIGDPKRPATLIDALLASSAFPGVFRPRWSWEVFVGDNRSDQLVDGGVMDNLPLTAVVDYLSGEVVARRAATRPQNETPHLIFTGSLERDPRRLSHEQAARVAARWPDARRHAREHQYNGKIDSFATAQREFREIYSYYSSSLVNQPWLPVDIEVVVAKPRWLCGTFAFHPMLGFERPRQAASIAHGCATTLATFAALEKERARWLNEWHIDGSVRASFDHAALRTLTPKTKADGTCHFRTAGVCPFSSAATEGALGHGGSAVNDVYQACGRRTTHQSQT